ncbi:MAG: NAD(P)-binding domain-containing protein [Lachnospiraceae bacterium]|nr:NAD(P)-binding domain-containing protein [Lachnospiraceae bacterium]
MHAIHNIIVYGSDKRQLALQELFKQAGAVTVSPTRYNESDIQYCQEQEAGCTILLPVPCPGEIREQILKDAAPGSLILGGNLPSEFVARCLKQGLLVYDYLDSPSVVIQNGIATAEGAICEAIRHSPWNLYQHNCLVMGYGRCGSVLADRLLGMGAYVIVSARDPQKAAKAQVMGCSLLSDNTDLSQCYFVFNTVPAPVLTSSLLNRLPGDAVIIDIASAPGGCDFTYCEKKGLQAALYPGLPAKYAPKSSAEIIFKHLNEVFQIGSKGKKT